MGIFRWIIKKLMPTRCYDCGGTISQVEADSGIRICECEDS